MNWLTRMTIASISLGLVSMAGCSRGLEGRQEASVEAIPRVQVANPRREAVERTIKLAASVRAYQEVPLYAKATGYIKSIPVDIGDRVVKGQVMATLEIPEMKQRYIQAESELDERQAQLAKAKAEAKLQTLALERSKALRHEEAITQQSLDEVRAGETKAGAQVRVAKARHEKAKARLTELRTLMDYAAIKAPFDGIVTGRFVDHGMLVLPGTSGTNAAPVVRVAQTSTVRVSVDVPEPDVPFIDKADKAVLTLSAMPNRRFTGQISRFAGALDPHSRTMRTEVDLENQDGALLPGMFGTLAIALDTHRHALTIRAQAVYREKGGAFVYVVNGTQVKKRKVRPGISTNGRVEILEGLEVGSRIVVDTSKGLTDGADVELAEGPRMGEPGARP